MQRLAYFEIIGAMSTASNVEIYIFHAYIEIFNCKERKNEESFKMTLQNMKAWERLAKMKSFQTSFKVIIVTQNKRKKEYIARMLNWVIFFKDSSNQYLEWICLLVFGPTHKIIIFCHTKCGKAMRSRSISIYFAKITVLKSISIIKMALNLTSLPNQPKITCLKNLTQKGNKAKLKIFECTVQPLN